MTLILVKSLQILYDNLFQGSGFCELKVWRIVQSENLSRTAAVTSIQLVPSRPLSKVTSETVEMNLLRRDREILLHFRLYGLHRNT